MTQMVVFIDRNIKTILITVVHMFKKLKERFNMLDKKTDIEKTN